MYERLGYEQMGIPLPLPTNELKDMERDSLILLTHHVLLAARFGRFYHVNPLLQALHQSLHDAANLPARTNALVIFLQQHQNAFTEPAHG